MTGFWVYLHYDNSMEKKGEFLKYFVPDKVKIQLKKIIDSIL